LLIVITWLINGKELKKQKKRVKFRVEVLSRENKKEPDGLVLVQFVTPIFGVAE
jgi:hypothetical protein